MIKVVAFKGNPPKHVDSWGGNGDWEGPLPATYRGTRGKDGWEWSVDQGLDVSHVSDVRIGITKKSKGQTVEQWARSQGADHVVVYARSAGEVLIDQEAEKDEHAPGTVDKEDAGSGGSGKVGTDADGTAKARGQEGGVDGGTGNSLGPSEKEMEDVADFEKSIGITGEGDDEHTTGDTSGGNKPGGQGKQGGDPEGRTGEDTSLSGQGPGGEKAKYDGDGKGSEDGGTGGSEGGSKDGKDGGDPDGMVGGSGVEGDGVPSAMGVWGGVLGVPQFLKGFVELALILSEADFTGFGKKAVKETVEHLVKQGAKQAGETTASAIRSGLAKKARREAKIATKKALHEMAHDKLTSSWWKKASKADKDAFARRVHYEHVDKFYKAAAKEAKAELKRARKMAKKYPKNTSVKNRVAALEEMQEAAKVKPVAGRLPQNHAYAGKSFPADQLPAKYRKKGLQFTEDGYPNFEPHAMQLKNGKKRVDIEYTGSRDGDFAAANKAAKLDETPENFVWHHVEDGRGMMLIPRDLHDAVKHTGGVAHHKHATGVAHYD